MFKPARSFGSKAAVRRGLRLPMLALSAALFCLPSVTNSAPAADPIKGEATLTAQPGYARLVLKFQEDVPTDVTVAGAILVIQFKKPVNVPIELLGDAVPGYVGAVRRDPDGTAIRMALAQKITRQHDDGG